MGLLIIVLEYFWVAEEGAEFLWSDPKGFGTSVHSTLT